MPIEAVPPAPARVLSADETFRCTTVTVGRDEIWIRATGELDVASAPELERALDEAQTGAPVVVLDLNDLVFIDSSGVRVIVEASEYARIAGHRLIVVLRPQPPGVFDLVGTVLSGR